MQLWRSHVGACMHACLYMCIIHKQKKNGVDLYVWHGTYVRHGPYILEH
jgi:hypothetical protein